MECMAPPLDPPMFARALVHDTATLACGTFIAELNVTCVGIVDTAHCIANLCAPFCRNVTTKHVPTCMS
jgi:hypothetical protein